MSQLSLFSAEARPERRGDLAGLLCGPGRITRFGRGDTARLGVVVADAGRAAAIRAAAAPFGIPFELGPRGCSGRELRTAYRRDLAPLARAWTGADRGKAVPPDFQLDGAALRLWVLASGRPDGRGGYLLPLDREAPQTHGPLVAATTRLGLPPARVTLPVCETCAAPVGEEDEVGEEEPVGEEDEVSLPPEAAGAAPHPGDINSSAVPAGPDDPVVHLDGPGTTLVAEDVSVLCPTHHDTLRLAPPAHRTAECPAAGPALRITGARRLQRLVELVGPAPDGVDSTGWPRYWGRTRG